MKRMVIALYSVPTQQMQNVNLNARKVALKQAVDKAWQLATQELARRDSSAMQKKPYGLFLAPEYFMAQPVLLGIDHAPGNQRQMDEGEKEQRLAEFKEISNAAKGLIIVPGTIAWRKPFQRTGAKMYHSKGPQAGQLKVESRYDKAVREVQAYANRMNLPANAPLASPLGGVVPAPTTQSKLDLLQASSGPLVDMRPVFMGRNTAYVLYDGEVKFKYNKMGDFHEVLDGNNTVYTPGTLDGRFQVRTEGPDAGSNRPIDFGIEICLDHVFQTAARETQHLGQVDIHIITSAHVQHQKGNLAIKSGGYLAHACSVDTYTTVKKLSQGILSFSDSLKGDDPFKTEMVSGCPLKLWTVELDLSRALN